MNPEQLLYAKTHEWVQIDEAEGGKVATVGLSAFALEALTDLVYIELPKVGDDVTAGESMCEIESVKAVSDIYAPLAGKIVEVNDALVDNLEQISEDPYGAGWIVKIQVGDEAGMADLTDHARYQKQCQEEH